jgi:hypothetical protein
MNSFICKKKKDSFLFVVEKKNIKMMMKNLQQQQALKKKYNQPTCQKQFKVKFEINKMFVKVEKKHILFFYSTLFVVIHKLMELKTRIEEREMCATAAVGTNTTPV